jgi:DNA end-binding protein Ku
MPSRATASATISFGLVSIPVKVFTATSSKAVRFNMLDPRDKSRVKQQYVNASSGEVVERRDLVRGFEYARGQFVLVTDEELRALETKNTHTIEIEDFVPMERVDPIYFAASNLLGPDTGGAKAYRLLGEAMTLMGKVAVGRYSTRGRQQLVLLRSMGRGLVMHGLHYADEVRSFDDIEFGDEVELRKGEVDLATQLIEQLSRDSFDPGRYEDEYRRAILEAVDRKVSGEDVVSAPKPESHEQIIDLVAALKKSLAERSEPARPGLRRVRRPAKAKAAKPRSGGKSTGR